MGAAHCLPGRLCSAGRVSSCDRHLGLLRGKKDDPKLDLAQIGPASEQTKDAAQTGRFNELLESD